MNIMSEKYKVFVRGSTKTKEVLGEIAQKLNVSINSYADSDNSEFQFGKCPITDNNFNIWCTTSSHPMYFITHGYKEVTPEQFRKIWLEEESPKKENKPEPFCCKGCEKLKGICQRLAEEGFVDSSKNNFEEVVSERFYFFEVDHDILRYSGSDPKCKIVSPEEFYKRITGKPWKEKKKYLGFIGDSCVQISFLPTEIKNPKHLRGNACTCIFYVENNELTYCVIGKEPEDKSFEIVSYFEFLLELSKSKLSEQLEVEHLLTPEDCFESKQKIEETNFVQFFVKNSSENFLHLSEEKPLKIIL